jgi:thiamine biosynthesis lipoprotein
VPSGVGLDVGGIAKGFAADLVTDELLAAGATGALVNLGGDIRVRGRPPAGDRWPISVADPFDPGRELLRLAIEDGAVATSSRLARRWVGASGRPSHHLIDPVSGAPMESDVVAVTVVAGEGWWAEAQTKALFALGAEHGLRQLRNASAAVVDSRGRLATTPDLEAARR